MMDFDQTAAEQIDAEIARSVLDSLDGAQQAPKKDDRFWLALARSAYDTSTDYLDANIRKQWERSIAHQNSDHPSDSKYHSDAYRLRSKVFRPKTRSNNLSAEASMAQALFSTSDLVSITAVNDNDPAQQASAEINQALLQYRLSKTIPWFLTAMGAYQDARVYGVCASYQSWKLEKLIDTDEYGNSVETVIRDEPSIDLLPPENIRFEANADWRNPVNASPYLIIRRSVYAGDFEKLAEQNGWHPYGRAALLAASQDKTDDATRRQRQGDHRNDPADANSAENSQFRLIWLHENFIRVDGIDRIFWTVGTKLMLSAPAPVSEVYPHLNHGERPVVLGIALIEAHKTYPASPTRLIEPLQETSNEVANQRLDNVKLVLNKRYLVRRGQTGIDLAALSRSVPGGSVMTNNPDTDVRVLETSDVTASSYQEQDRLDLAMDEISGTFSQQTVQNNRNLNETVGGMEMMNSGASAVAEYAIKTFIETWVEPVIRQLVGLEQMYETDQAILALAAEQAETFQTFGTDAVMDDLLRQQLTVNVNIGFGANNPQQKMERFGMAMNSISMLPTAMMRLDEDQIIKEVFGNAGYRDGARFFKPIEEMPQAEQPQAPPPDPVKMAELELKQQQFQFEQQYRMAELELRREIEMQKLALQQGIKMSELETRLGMESTKNATTRQVEGARIMNEQAKIALQNANLQAGYDTF